jgi:hypothetical protein
VLPSSYLQDVPHRSRQTKPRLPLLPRLSRRGDRFHPPGHTRRARPRRRGSRASRHGDSRQHLRRTHTRAPRTRAPRRRRHLLPLLLLLKLQRLLLPIPLLRERLRLPLPLLRLRARLRRRRRPRCSGASCICEKQRLETGFSSLHRPIGSRVETRRRFWATGQLDATCTAPPRRRRRRLPQPLVLHRAPLRHQLLLPLRLLGRGVGGTQSCHICKSKF